MKISIITINFNNRYGLKKTIESVVNQSSPCIEYIVIDGGSNDGSLDIIRQYQDIISYWVSEPDGGIYSAMNKGVDKATGDYLLFLNSGDILSQNTTIEDVQPELLSLEDIVFGLVKYVPSQFIGYKDVTPPFTMIDFYENCPLPHPASFIKRDLFKKLKYDESLKIVADWKFFMESVIFFKASCKKIDFIITEFEEGGISSIKEKCDIERLKVLNDLFPSAVVKDYFRFLHGFKQNSDFELFFVQLRRYKYSNVVYTFSVLLVRLISYFKSSAVFARRFPLWLKK